ncbi:MAG TPA: diguanylate cyclase [Candidatus Avisuccinivibrio pullicola]|nr:diguanylate cyclase [Candidatus Avisuccinivibrio pullicola]
MRYGSEQHQDRKGRAVFLKVRSLTVTAIMVGLILMASSAVTWHINTLERQSCFDFLEEEIGALSSRIENRFHRDHELLRSLALLCARYADIREPELWEELSSFKDSGLLSSVEILLPGDRLLTAGGRESDVSGKLSFAREAALGEHLSSRENGLFTQDTYVLRHYLPVVRDGRIVALLMGVILVDELSRKLGVSPYGGRGEYFVVDGDNGDFIVDTWHPGRLGNMLSLGHRETAPEFQDRNMQQEIMAGKRDYIVIVSRTTGEYGYMYYAPLKIKNWRLVVAVPEDVVFENYDNIKAHLRGLCIFELVCFGLYLTWMARTVRTVTAEKQRRLDMFVHLNEMEQLLFNAHVHTENVSRALLKLACLIKAPKIALWLCAVDGRLRRFSLDEGKYADVYLTREEALFFAAVAQRFTQGQEEFSANGLRELHERLPEVPEGLYSVLAVPVREPGTGAFLGMLSLCNLKRDGTQRAFLRALTFSFALFCSNFRNRELLREEGDRDGLTGLYNRSRYERDLPQIERQRQSRESLYCVYIDVNGLREMNNGRGHEAGDSMLRTVASEIAAHFDSPYLYRTGGDEFVIFVKGNDSVSPESKAAALVLALEVHDYHIALGIADGRDFSSLSALIRAAEEKMYASKQRFYGSRQLRV